ncbi:16S rRNA (cytosine(1402)-N(4))-methyltransferase RsmH [Patescibacteria group bacterium]|nr:16S rRNA (cytosine(1402)-N(4))-methyltransferase RsmH [Patescibacteria group bacterium]MBU1721403.1 16S rRNA (cytosine(1402)-N(4))-methyltransferase RsmH [Patescibacteria group bacterium]MBU1901843.1 16S rRNA (cytosine(1402)-N(4))-methyltransferase RsmH [Patescibacteria group bacterium]
MRHIPVLLEEVIEYLDIHAGDTIIDCTLGDAGHTEAILAKNGPYGKVIGIDADAEALLRAKQFLYAFEGRVEFVRDNFVHLKNIVTEHAPDGVQGILMDFGWSTPQFEDRGRGFSFTKSDEPLDMRYGKQVSDRTAEEILMQEDLDTLHDIFATYGEEKFAKDIAQEIIAVRKTKDIQKVKDFVDIILTVYRQKLKTDKDIPWIGGLHPATKVFQALRIAVNKELDVIKSVLPDAIDALAPGGRLAVISFHSLEDRIVKHIFKSEQSRIKIITKKPVIATEQGVRENPRARSAKLRVIEKI